MSKGLEWLDRSLLTSPYCYALCLSEKAYKKELKSLGVPKNERDAWISTPQADATLHYFEPTPKSGHFAIVCLKARDGVELEQVYAILVHEAVHLWRVIREHIGEHSPAAEEEAYAIQRIAQSLMYSYKEQTGGKSCRSTQSI